MSKEKTVKKKVRTFWQDFKKFASKGNIIDLAVAVVVGAAFNKIISTLVSSIITPLTGLVIKTGDLAALKWVIKEAVVDAEGAVVTPEVAVTYGVFLQSLIDFIVIALCMFIVLRLFMKLKESLSRKEKEAAEAKAKEEAEAAAAKAHAEAEVAAKAAEAAAAETARQEQIRQELIRSVAAQADLLTEIRDLMKQNQSQNK